jgi:ubiquitin C-terminal hydrolase
VTQRYGVDGTTDKVPLNLTDAVTLQLDVFRATRTESQYNEPAFIDDETMRRMPDDASPSDLDKHCFTDGPGKYDLRAIVVYSCHMTTLLSSHDFEYDYMAYARAGITKAAVNGGDWMLFDDDQTRRVTLFAVPVNKAYMMFHSRDFEYMK